MLLSLSSFSDVGDSYDDVKSNTHTQHGHLTNELCDFVVVIVDIVEANTKRSAIYHFMEIWVSLACEQSNKLISHPADIYNSLLLLYHHLARLEAA